ncbi:MgtC/SapB family protein [candidate division KSB1 bacterium]|nr:MgtC/SapB family protein [candidate division KSB1 bacterium]
MNDTDLLYRFGAALAVGILIGMQREYAGGEKKSEIAAGVRTFSLLSLLGCLAAMVSDLLNSPWPLVASVLGIALLLAINYYFEAARREPGLTTETAALLTLFVGALTYTHRVIPAIAAAVLITFLLSFKPALHQFARRLTVEDITGTLKFALISAVVLPILPNRPYGPEPFDVFNPYRIWLLVVMISGISFLGYLLIKLIGSKRGIGLTGFLGGLASSTAVTLSFSQKSRRNSKLSSSFALAITIAWTVMFLRMLIVVAILNVSLAKMLVWPLSASIVVGLIYCLFLYRKYVRGDEKSDVEFSNPFELGPAIKFASLFVVILLISKIALIRFGDAGLYFSSFFSGLADVDAIALSVAQLSADASLTIKVASRAIVLAAVSNTLSKGAIVIATGDPALRRAIWPGFVLMLVTGLMVAFLLF